MRLGLTSISKVGLQKLEVRLIIKHFHSKSILFQWRSSVFRSPSFVTILGFLQSNIRKLTFWYLGLVFISWVSSVAIWLHSYISLQTILKTKYLQNFSCLSQQVVIRKPLIYKIMTFSGIFFHAIWILVRKVFFQLRMRNNGYNQILILRDLYREYF